ncbi:MAG: family 43 glycosylhydrolase [Bacilli bacterium]|jgi:beta-xylosidase
MIDIKDLRIRDPFVLKEAGTYYLYSNGVKKDGRLTIVSYPSIDMKTFDDPVDILGNHEYGRYTDFWAPEVIKYHDRFYLVMTMSDQSGHRGSYIFVGDGPLGPFHRHGDGLITPKDMMCLDGHIFVDNDQPYLLFCHEWLECVDGGIMIAKLSGDLTKIVGEVTTLFVASSAPWTVPLVGNSYVTDGPFIYKKDKVYHMLWSSFSRHGYALGYAYSDKLLGPWKHQNEPIYDNDGGHGMVFTHEQGQKIIIHSPNIRDERALLLDMVAIGL